MTRQDRTMLLGCFAAAIVAMISLSAAPVPKPSQTVVAAEAQPLQLARVHTLTGAARMALVY